MSQLAEARESHVTAGIHLMFMAIDLQAQLSAEAQGCRVSTEAGELHDPALASLKGSCAPPMR